MTNISNSELVNRFIKELLSQSEGSSSNLKDTLHSEVEFKVLGKSTGYVHDYDEILSIPGIPDVKFMITIFQNLQIIKSFRNERYKGNQIF